MRIEDAGPLIGAVVTEVDVRSLTEPNARDRAQIALWDNHAPCTRPPAVTLGTSGASIGARR